MIIDEGAQQVKEEKVLDLTLTKRMFTRLHPDALSNPPVIPSLGDFEREYHNYVLPEQDAVLKLLVKALVGSVGSPKVTQALVSVVLNLLPRAIPIINEVYNNQEAPLSDAAKQVLDSLKKI